MLTILIAAALVQLSTSASENDPKLIACYAKFAAKNQPQQCTSDDPEEAACYARFADINKPQQCASEALKRAEAQLSKYLDRALSEYEGKPNSTKLLKRAEANWLVYRAAWCDLIAQDNHGILLVTKDGCRAKLTRQRTETLRDLLLGTNE